MPTIDAREFLDAVTETDVGDIAIVAGRRADVHYTDNFVDDLGSASTSPSILGTSGELGHAVENDSVSVRDQTYRVKEIEPSSGLVRLILELTA